MFQTDADINAACCWAVTFPKNGILKRFFEIKRVSATHLFLQALPHSLVVSLFSESPSKVNM